MQAELDLFYNPDGTINVRRLGRLISRIENEPEYADKILAKIYRENNEAQVLGITGPPGAGKSSIIDLMITQYREQGKKVAIIAVDPSSPFTGGAILGDRVRMLSHATDPNVFIRSMASRGKLGGLAPATVNVTNLLTSIGFDVVIIETVGVGQSEIDVMHLVDTVLLVLVPGLGDDIQLLKAGIIEIASIFVINKADRPGAEKLLSEVHTLLTHTPHQLDWLPPVVELVATEQSGIGQLMEEIQRHTAYITAHYDEVKQPKIASRIRYMFEDKINTRISSILESDARFNAWLQRVLNGGVNPYVAMSEFDKRLKITWEE